MAGNKICDGRMRRAERIRYNNITYRAISLLYQRRIAHARCRRGALATVPTCSVRAAEYRDTVYIYYIL